MQDKREIEKLLQKIIKKAKDGDAYYHYGVEYSSDQDKPAFKAYVGWSKEGVQPVQFSETSRAKLVKELEYYLATADKVDVRIKYHLGLAEANDKAAEFHREWLKNYQKAIDEAVHSKK